MSEWIPCSSGRMPEDLEEVNVTWVNHNPEPYYIFAKDKPFTATAVYYKEKWYWYSSTCADLLAEYGRNPNQEIDDGIEIIAWMPLPEPYGRVDKKMNKQRKVLITITYNEMGVIIDTKAEEMLPSAEPEKRTEERTETHACDCISRQAAIDLVRDVCDAVMSECESWYDPEIEDEVYKDIREVDAILKCNKEVRIALRNMPSAQPEIVHCEFCEHWKNEHLCECLSRHGTFETPKDFFCGYGKAK